LSAASFLGSSLQELAAASFLFFDKNRVKKGFAGGFLGMRAGLRNNLLTLCGLINQ